MIILPYISTFFFALSSDSVTTIETLRNYFESYGEIIDIYMPNGYLQKK